MSGGSSRSPSLDNCHQLGMEKSTTPPHTLEYAPLCKQLSVVLFGVFLVSFTVTWYKVWWDTLIGLAVAVYGYYILHDTNPANLNAQKIRYFHYGTVASVASHVIALGVTTYFVIKIYLLDKVVDLESGPGISLFVFLYIFLLLEIGVTAFAVERTHNLCAEISRNEYFLQNDARA